MFLFLLAQEFSGCFMLDAYGNYINLNDLCNIPQIQEVRTVDPTPQTTSDRLTPDQIYLTQYRIDYCEFIAQGKTLKQASDMAHDSATNQVIRLTSDLNISDQALYDASEITCK